jgi:hypothetical protein
MSISALSKGLLAGGVFTSLVLAATAGAQSPSTPDLSGGEGGWLHDGGATFPPVEGSVSPVVQDPAHPFISQAASWRLGDISNPNLKDWVKQVMKKDNDEILAGKIAFQARSSCVPSGIPNMFLPGNALQIVQTPTKIVMFKQGNWEFRHIYMNVPHSANVKPSWYGESVGHYENGDTLVIDTIGLNDKTFVDNYRTPHTTQIHVTERWKLAADGQSIEVTVFVEDPGAFTTPWKAVQRWRRVETAPILTVPCNENNGDFFNQGLVPLAEAKTPDF